ncbi:N-6 DNA methylase [Streptacidiphilus rugosus]|uniref:N-6 DNA methylase n=1 Tax=Streptacidiphilus rugosus TaxID=405783 RepID=UPI0006911D3C|nr:N-6 DNA methylase [Streptacidiphilus rugosus]
MAQHGGTDDPSTGPASSEVTAGAIARLAGVGPAAVSNWRRRHADFPRPVGGTPSSPTFALDEVERWLLAEGKLTRIPLRERVWQLVEQHPAGPVAALLGLGEALLHTPADPGTPLVTGALELAASTGAAEAFDFLLTRHLDAVSRQYTLTPAEPAALMVELAGPAATVLDPACGFGTLLRAALTADPTTTVRGQETDADLAALARLRLALSGAAPDIRVGDSLRADAFDRPPLAPGADVVVCHPPFNVRNWGHEELAYDDRWDYGFPPRSESELAWVQQAVAHTREGGTAVVLMPPAAASRRSGRRVRAELLRRGALRAVIALPAGVAPPYGIPLHLWVLRRPVTGAPVPQQLLLVETAGLGWPEARSAALDAWRAADAGAAAGEQGLHRVVPVVELLDEEVDLTPARHLASPAVDGGAPGLDELRDRLAAALDRVSALPPSAPPGPGGGRPTVTVGELVRAGALALLTSGAEEAVRTEPGDVVVPLLGQDAAPRTVDVVAEDGAGAPLARGLQLLRADPRQLDPWFLAGFLRGSANSRQASTFTGTSSRLDARRVQLPRLPLAEQQRYGRRFREVAGFEAALRLAGQLGEQFAQGLYDGLTEGVLGPE